ncbi:MAG: 30S ribosomal protein S27ae [Candidatus Woesearchaeota archaeon]
MARKQSKKHPTKVWKLYVQGKSKNKFCPKCGKGYFLAAHKDRSTCGKCGYTEFIRKS